MQYDPSQYIDDSSQYVKEFCRQSEQNCPKPRLFKPGDLAFGLQLCSLFSTYVTCLYISLRALIALYWCKRPLRERPTRERAPEPEQEPSSPHVASLKSAPVASAETLAEVAKEIEAKLTALGLEFVTLDLAARIINLTNKLEFEGSKSVGGPGAFKDPEQANKACKEVAIALSTCNQILKARGYASVGLSIEGHTSEDLGNASVNSLLRSRTTMKAIGKALRDIEGKESGLLRKSAAGLLRLGRGRQVGHPILNAVGHGSTKRLPGFDDGGNYAENRRVELLIIDAGTGKASALRSLRA